MDAEMRRGCLYAVEVLAWIALAMVVWHLLRHWTVVGYGPLFLLGYWCRALWEKADRQQRRIAELRARAQGG